MAYTSYTLTDMQALLKEKWESVPFWSDAEATIAINEGLLMWNLMTGLWRDSLTITTTPNFEYSLGASLVFGTRVMFNNIPLAPTSMDEMDAGRPGWQVQSTAMAGMPTAPQVWLPISIDLIAIWPYDATGGNTLTVDGVARTPRLVNPADFLTINSDTVNVILGYALHVAALKEGGERFAATQPLFADFLKAAADENDQLLSSQKFRHFIGTDQSRITSPDTIPSTYDKLL